MMSWSLRHRMALTVCSHCPLHASEANICCRPTLLSRTFLHTRTHTHTRTRTHTHTHTHTHTVTHTHTHTHTRTRAHAHTNTHAHAHSNTPFWSKTNPNYWFSTMGLSRTNLYLRTFVLLEHSGMAGWWWQSMLAFFLPDQQRSSKLPISMTTMHDHECDLKRAPKSSPADVLAQNVVFWTRAMSPMTQCRVDRV